MTLKKYKDKRSFDNTPEPRGGEGTGDVLHFVVQKHDASRLHYDFRLEMQGVLKSWAVPKGPSQDPAVKRLAMKVEDHPYDYKDFEGVIPEGNYGAGTVIVWDEGTYEAIDGSENKGKKQMEAALLKELKSGNLKIRLKGKKLKGAFALVKTNADSMGENAWLLIKHKDQFASQKDITEKDKSVKSGKTISRMEVNPVEVYGKNTKGTKSLKSDTGSKSKTKVSTQAVSEAPKKKSAKKAVASKSVDKRASDKTAVKVATAKKAQPDNSISKKKSGKPTALTQNIKKDKDASGRNSTKASSAVVLGSEHDLETALKGFPRSAMPRQLAPMLATLVDAPFDGDDWEFEVKWDGYRAISYINRKNTAGKKEAGVQMMSRNNKPFEEKYYPITEALKSRKEQMVVDGEIVVINPNTGSAQFNALQNWRSEADGQLMYYVFDLLWYEGRDLTGHPLSMRRAILSAVFEKIVPASGGEENNTGQQIVRVGFSVDGRGNDFFASAKKLGLEGMVAKRLDSLYLPGDRSKDWLKVKVQKRQEVIIIGYTHNQNSPKLFSALLLGVYRGKQLHYAGKVGTGFNDRQQKEMVKEFKPLIRKTCPLRDLPDYNKPSRFRPSPPYADATWLKPILVGEVSYAERTADGVFRHPSFKGFRKDKAARDVVLEIEADTENVVDVEKVALNTTTAGSSTTAQRGKRSTKTNKVSPADMEKQIIKKSRTTGIKEEKATKGLADKKVSNLKSVNIKTEIPVPNSGKTLLNPTEETQVKKVGRVSLKFTNLSKLYWPKEKITKRELINYYYQIAPFILPYLDGRPQSLNRFPGGILEQNFYQKDVTGKVADWVSTYLYHSEGDRTDKHFLVADGLASLVYMASLGCIEMNPWSSTVKKPDNPTWCIIDLDPSKKRTGKNKTGKDFEEVIQAAQMTHDVLESLGIVGYPKTSGATGMHIYIPLGARYSYEQSKEFARIIVTMVQKELPSFTTLERNVAARKGKMYLDFLQNRPQATIAAPYSVRPKPGATVSMPLDWSEVKPGLKREDFTIKSAPERLKEIGDLFKPVLGKGINLNQVIKQAK
ncbi:MAG TPA: non-homologous end-joining DNA ligase [Arachidicoccus sp.]|nr:non-homologous end-joining DNA ligase [Arachidicoccus sp.]